MTSTSTNSVERTGYSCISIETLVELCGEKQHQACRKGGCCYLAEGGDAKATFQKCRKISLVIKEGEK